MNTFTSLKCAAVLLPALAVGMPMANASDEKRDDPQDTEKTSSEFGSERQDQRKSTTLPARSQANANNEFFENMPDRGYHSDSLVGQEVKSRTSNESVGEISNLLLDENGHIVAVILSVGGTLGMGERDVAIAWDQIERQVDGDEITLLVNQTEQSLKDAPKYSSKAKNSNEMAYSSRNEQRDNQSQNQNQENNWPAQPAKKTARSGKNEQSTAYQSDDDEKATAYQSDANKQDSNMSDTDMPDANETAHSQFLANMPASGFHSDSLVGLEITNRNNNEAIGEISNLVLDENGQVVAAIVSVGGLMGLGERDVAISWDQIEREVDGDETTLFIDLDESSLKDAPKYKNQ